MKFCILFLLIMFSLVSCIADKGKIKIGLKVKNPPESNSVSTASVSSVQVVNNQLVITGTGLSDVENVKVDGHSLNEDFTIDTKTATKIIANSIRGFSFDVSKVFNLILSDANASATFPIDFSLCNATLNGKGFNCAITAVDKDVLSYDAASGTWKPRAATGINYLGAFNASANPPAPTPTPFPSSGSYYIVSADGMIGATSFVVGDWLISNGTGWQKIGNSTLVTSVFSRTGNVVAQEGDYDLDKLTDVDLSIAPTNGKVLKFNGIKWIASDDLSGGGASSVTATEIAAGAVTDVKIDSVSASKITGTLTSAQIADGTIVNADINAAAAIDYSKLNIPDVTIPYAKLSIADGDIPASKISGIPAVTSVLATAIVDGDTTHAPDGNAVFDALGLKFNSTGGVLTIGTISGIPLPTNDDDVVNKQYVDSYGQWTKNGSDIYRASGNVGIGTTTPTAKLDVVGSINAQNGINTTFQAANKYSGGFNVYKRGTTGDSSASVTSGTELGFHGFYGWDGVTSTRGAYAIAQTTEAWSPTARGTNYAIATTPNGSITNIERMRIDQNGNVGIGTTLPTSRLSVVGSAAGTDGTNNNFTLYDSASVLRTKVLGTGAQAWYLNSGTAEVGSVAYSTPSSSPGIVFFNASGTGRSQIRQFGSSGGLAFASTTGSTIPAEQMVLTTTGNVGIGTTVPKETLHVYGGLALKRTIIKDDTLSGWDGINPIARVSGLVSQYSGEVYTVTISSRGTNYARAQFLRNARAAEASYLYRTSLEGNANITAVMDSSDNMLEFYSNITSAVPGDTVVKVEMVIANDALTTEVISINPGASTVVGGINHTEQTWDLQYFSGNVGIGTPTPSSPLDIIFGNGTISNDVKARGVVSEYYGVGNHAGKGGVAMIAGGTKAAPTAVAVGNTSSLAMPLFYDGSIWRVGSRIDSYVSAVTSNTSVASGLTFNVGTATADSASGLFTGVTEAMRILPSGYVGIGTNAPQGHLDVRGNTLVGTTTAGAYISQNGQDGFRDAIRINRASGNFTIGTSASGVDLQIGAGTTLTDANAKLVITTAGNVGIGTTIPGYKLQVGVAADGSEARANAWNVLSDERLKRDFEIIPESLEKILSLNGYYYYWNRGTDTSKKLGLKAQEVEKVFPEVVSHGKDGFLSVSYNHLVAGVIEAVKEFFIKWQGDSKGIHREIASLKKENELLKRKNLETEARLKKLEQAILINKK